MSTWSVYILRNERNALYTGISSDPQRRLAEHRSRGGRGARFTRGCATLDLVYRCAIGDRSLALKVESRIKGLKKDRKEALVALAPGREDLLKTLHLLNTTEEEDSR